MRTTTITRWLPAIALLAMVGATSEPSAAADKLSIATLAPRTSLWGKVFAAWSKAVDKQTKGQLKLRFYWNGTQGDGAAVVAKIRAGQLDGATLGANGLATVHKPVLALQMPGLFSSWQSIDRAREAVYPRFFKAFDDQGLYLSTIGDVGRARTMSKGRAIRRPEDLRGMKPFAPQRSLVAPEIAAVLRITPVRVSIPGLLPALTAGRVNVVTAPPLAAEQLQWTPYLDHISADVSGIAVGAMVMSKQRLEALPADVRVVLDRTGRKAGRLLRKRVRKQDDRAYRRLRKRMTLVKLSEAERGVWAKAFAKVRQRLAQRTFPADLVAELESIAGR
jgi:TRAP-type C4-dicarboxylate transport system substrate-binding protein